MPKTPGGASLCPGLSNVSPLGWSLARSTPRGLGGLRRISPFKGLVGEVEGFGVDGVGVRGAGVGSSAVVVSPASGSFFAPDPDGKGKMYIADQERIAVAMLYHGACVLNLASAAGSPYKGDDKGYEVRAKVVAPLETEVTVLFQVMKKVEAK